jgi:hypothetical protein
LAVHDLEPALECLLRVDDVELGKSRLVIRGGNDWAHAMGDNAVDAEI